MSDFLLFFAVVPKYTLRISINFVNFLSITPKTYRITNLSSLFLTKSLNLHQLSSPLVAVPLKMPDFQLGIKLM